MSNQRFRLRLSRFPITTRHKLITKKFLRNQTEHPKLGSMPTKNIKLMKKQTKLFLSSIVKISDGKQMYASFPKVMLSMDPTVRLKRRHKISHNLTISST